MNDKKEFEEAVDAVGNAFANLVAVAFTGSATLQEAVKKVESVLSAMHGTLTRCAIAVATKKKGESKLNDHEEIRKALGMLIDACDTFEQALEYALDGHYDTIPGYVDYAHDFVTRVNSARAVLKDKKGDMK